MQPADEPGLSSADRRAMMHFVEHSLFGIDRENPDPGRVVLRRLNRIEYASTVWDLTGLEIDIADELPLDDTGYGFDTIDGCSRCRRSWSRVSGPAPTHQRPRRSQWHGQPRRCR